MTREMILKEALSLPTKERADVAARLLDSLDEADAVDQDEIDRAWAFEIERRARRVMAAKDEGRPWEDVRKDLLDRLSGA